MNLLDLRQGLFDSLDWDARPTTAAVSRMDRFVNRAYNQVALDVPFLFFEDEFVLRTLPDVVPTLDSDTITPDAVDVGAPSGGANPWVFTVDTAQNQTNFDAGAVEWNADRTWDGRYIEILDDNGVYRTLRIRSVWVVSTVASFSTWTPWDIAQWGSGPFADWRVFSSEYYLPDDLVDIKHLAVYHEQNHLPITVLPQAEAENLGLAEHDADAPTGLPQMAFRRRHEQIRGPVTAPTVALGSAADASQRWHGPEPHGQFQYIVTYCWGKRTLDHRNPGVGWFEGDASTLVNNGFSGGNGEIAADSRTVEPIFESAPSPASSAITVSAADNNYAGCVRVTVPNIEYMLGFLMSGNSSAGSLARSNTNHSGWFVRIYRKRLSMDVGAAYQDLGPTLTGQSIPTLHLMDFDDGYYLLAEMAITATNEGIYDDKGQVLPDHNRRLRDVHGYQSLRFYPHPDDGYEVRIRGTRRPEKLLSPYDVPRVHSEACELILAKALEFHYENLHDTSGAMASRARYADLLRQLRQRYGTAVPASQPIPRRPVRYPRAGRNRTRRR